MLDFKVNRDSKLYRRSLGWTLSGLAVQLLGAVVDLLGGALAAWVVPIVLGGTVLVVIGLTLMARSKGRSPLWGLLGLLSLFGWLLLAMLADGTAQAVDDPAS